MIGVARAEEPPPAVDEELHRVQADLFEIGACLASGGSDDFPGVAKTRVTDLEASIDTMESTLEPLTSFIFPGGSKAAAQLHLGRTVCRRAERLISSLDPEQRGETTLIYLNRLSDWLFVAARYANHESGRSDIPWHR